MKRKRNLYSGLILMMVLAMLLTGCGKEPLPETTSEELGVYVMNNTFVDANGGELLKDGAPVYWFDEDGNVVTSGEKKDVVVIAAENAANFTCINEAVVNDADTKKSVLEYVLSDGSEIYGTCTWELPIMVVPDLVVNSSFTVETADPKTLYFNDGESKLEFDGTEDVVLEVTACYPGETKIFVTNCLGEIVKTIDVSVAPEISTDEETIAGLEAKVAACTHEYESDVVPATETTEGYTQYTCKHCGHMYRADYKDKLPCSHTFTEREVKATCTEKGYTLCTCTKCGHVEKRNFTELAEHTYRDEIVPSTCSEKGYTKHTCTICNHVEKDNYTELAEHTYRDEIVPSTCSAEGYTLHTCTVCKSNYKDNYTETKAHTYMVSTVSPTYTERGYTLHSCSVCGHSFKDSYTEKLVCTNHSYMETGRTEPTCTNTGTVTKTCSRCGHVAHDSIPAKGHSYNDSVSQPTCTEQGQTTHTCSICGSSYSDTNIPALGHNWETHDEQKVIGSEEHTFCSQCGLDFATSGVDLNSHIKEHVLNGEGGAYHTNLVPIYGTVTVTVCTRCGASQ